jgi:hypothetical protein
MPIKRQATKQQAETAKESGVRRRGQVDANDLKPDPWDHPHDMIVEGLPIAVALKGKLKTILAPVGSQVNGLLFRNP